jgi:diguanylate cyclase
MAKSASFPIYVQPPSQLAIGAIGLETKVSTEKCSLLVVDDEPYILPTLAALLASDFTVVTADCAEAAQSVFAKQEVHIVLTDQKMPRMTGVQLLEWVRVHHPNTIRLLMTGYAELDDAVEAINRGQVYYYLLKPWRTEELLQILRNACKEYRLERNQEHLLEELRVVNDELKQLNSSLEKRVVDRTKAFEEANILLQKRTHELERLALTDPLTGLLNRRAIVDLARSELKRHARYPNPLALGLVDIDFFKDINSRFLLTGGDEVLKALAKILTDSLRSTDSLGRWGGEEFMVVAPETDFEGARVLAERIRSTVEDTPIYYNSHPIHVTVSVGFAVADDELPVAFDRMEIEAAAAEEEAKMTGKNRSVIRSMKHSPVRVVAV